MSGLKSLQFDDTLVIDTGVFSLDTVKRAAYKFAAQAQLELRSSEGFVTIYISLKDSSASVESIKAALHQEVLDQDLRETIRAETESVRTLILANAFSKTSLIQG